MTTQSFTVVDEKSNNTSPARFTVFGVGGGGGNAVQHMMKQDIKKVRFVCANTDLQALNQVAAPNKVQIGVELTGGLGAGGKPEIGRESAVESREEIRQHLEGADMVFVTAGMGGGTGTGAAPVIAEIAKENGLLTVGVVTTPFRFEGRKRTKAAEQGIAELEKHVDSLIVIPNNRLLDVYGDISMEDAFAKADNVLLNAVRSIFDVVDSSGYINLDFNDLKSVMSTRGYGMMGIGYGRGDNRGEQAIESAIRSPLLDNINIEDAKGILLSIAGGRDLTLKEVEAIAYSVEAMLDEDAEFFYGQTLDPDMNGEIRVTVIATGLTRNAEPIESKPKAVEPIATSITEAQTPVEDMPAIHRQEQAQTQHVAPVPSGPRSIADFLKSQQQKK